ncbi:hypothetical protein [Spirillospora sp. NBC_01491]|uniref:hypothetical protein n=1 Tax=Spirillospora sp. NBC_01491 TaxID=2976007 RepID=UPI002E37AAFE|nr:hypothetical protein [Spirillospora sp. NBC_01491]
MSPSIDPETAAALERVRDRLIDRYLGTDPNVTGVGIGFRTRGGERTDEPAVVVGVVEKLPAGHVPRGRLLPRAVRDGGTEWAVDVVQTGRILLTRSPGAAAR